LRCVCICLLLINLIFDTAFYLNHLSEYRGTLYSKPDVPDEVKIFHAEMKALWDGVEEYGVKRDELKRPYTMKHYAEGGDVLREYNQAWRIHSKYVHPTSYLLFGKASFVFGEDVQRYFWVVVQYFAARNLRDLHLMVEAARSHS
jgi:hypothetical protein